MEEKKETKKNSKFSPKYWGYDFVRLTAAIPGLLALRSKRIYVSDSARKRVKGGCIMMSNHMGMFDPMFLIIGIWWRRHHFIATKELFDSKFRKFLFTYFFLCIRIDRDSSMISTMNKAVAEVNKGNMVTMFPEGHVNQEDNEVKDFKGGVVLIARRTGAPIIPVYLRKRKSVFERQLFVIGEPIYVSELLKTMSARDIPSYIHEKEEELKNLAMEYKKK